MGAHFTPSAQFILQSQSAVLPNDIFLNKKIPLKSGVPKIKFCIKWNITIEVFDKLRKKAKAILPEIALKYLNTYEFLFEQAKEDNNG